MKKVASKKAPTINKKIKNVASGIGKLVWWDFYSCRPTPAVIEAALNKNGITDIKVPEIDPTAAVKTAARQFRFRNGSKYKAEIAASNEKEVIINILKLTQVSDTKKEWHSTNANLVWDVGGKSFLSEGDKTCQANQKLHSLIKELQTTLDHGFIRPKIIEKKLREAGGCPLRSRGGIYYVPNSGTKVLKQLKSTLDDIGGVALRAPTQGSDNETKEAIGSSVKNEMFDRIKELEEKVSGWKESVKTRNLNSSAVSKTLQEFVDLKSQIESYAEALSFKADSLLGSLSAMKNEAELIIDGSKDRKRGVGQQIIDRFQNLLDQRDKYCIDQEANIFMIPVSDIASWPKGAKVQAYYDLNKQQSGARTLAHLGYQGEIKDDHLMVIPLGI